MDGWIDGWKHLVSWSLQAHSEPSQSHASILHLPTLFSACIPVKSLDTLYSSEWEGGSQL